MHEASAWSGPPPKLHIIGNLPFNISTPLITRWLDDISSQQGAWRYVILLLLSTNFVKRPSAHDNCNKCREFM